MTIAQKIIFSSNFIALLAAVATFMGWKHTQGIKNDLEKTITKATKEIHFLNDIQSDIIEIESALFVLINDLNNTNTLDSIQHLATGKVLNQKFEHIKSQLNDFSLSHTISVNNPSKTLIDLCVHTQSKTRSFFPSKGPLLQKESAINIGLEIQQVIKSFLVETKNANNQRFAFIDNEVKHVTAQITHLNFWLILCGGLTILMSIIFGQLIARNLSAELTSLHEAASQLNKGNYSARVGFDSDDEFGALAQTFNGMASNLQQAEIIETQNSKVKKLNRELKRKNDSLDSFVYRVSHDLKAPVLNMKSLLQLIKIKVAQVDTVGLDQPFTFLDESVIKLEKTIKDLLEVARIEQSLELTNVWVSLEERLTRILSENSQSILAESVSITSDFKIPEIFFPLSNIDSILSNLVNNAIKYSSRKRNPTIHLSTTEKDGFVCLRISDNGIGIDLKKHHKKLFGMFNRFHNHVEGSGVGLYIVKKIVEDAGGRIEIESEVEKGTTFSLFFKQQDVPIPIVIEA